MRKVILSAIFLPLMLGLSAQQSLEDNEAIKNVFADAEFFFASDDFIDALLEYQRLYKRGFSDNANINYKMGICYLNITGEKEKAISHLKTAIPAVSKNYRESALREKNAPFDTYLYLGNAYRVTNQLDSAISAYSKYLELTKSDENLRLNHMFAQKQIENCKNAKKFIDNPADITQTNLGRPVNNNAANFKAVVSGDETSMVYMNSLPFYDALYYSTKKSNGEWSTPTNITPQVQSDGDQYASGISYDGKILLLTREDAFDSDIYISYFEDGQWTKSSPIGTEINTKFWESHASISKDGKTLYFASNRRVNKGEMDIYESVKDSEGQWGPPVLLGSNINTNLNEDTPFITPDGKRLYFSSQGHNNMGGYDIFYVEKLTNGNWSKPTNLEYPINTTDDDLFYVPVNNAVGYMAKLTGEGGYGREDIYRYVTGDEEIAYEETLAEVSEEVAEEEENIVEEHEKQIAQESTETTKEIAKTEEIKQEARQEEGKEAAEVKEPAKVSIEKEKTEINIEPIFFEFNKSSLTGDAKQQLNTVLKLLQEQNSVTVKLLGYADELGNKNYNLSLSRKRAKAVADYLTNNSNVSIDRITLVGKGATAFIAINKNADGTDNPGGRKYNRRVEFVFDNTPEHLLIIQKDVVPVNLKIK